MPRPITEACHHPRVAALIAELEDLLADATVFVVVVGPLKPDGQREIVVGGDPDKEDERHAAADTLAGSPAAKERARWPLAEGLT